MCGVRGEGQVLASSEKISELPAKLKASKATRELVGKFSTQQHHLVVLLSHVLQQSSCGMTFDGEKRTPESWQCDDKMDPNGI